MADQSDVGTRLGLKPAEVVARFDRLQGKLAEQWKLIQTMNQLEQSMVVVPSVERAREDSATARVADEERLLCLLLLLRKPRARMVYCTSQPLQPEIVDYYLGLLPGVIPAHARSRLHLVPVHDSSPRPLSLKILERPRLVRGIRELLGDPATAHLVPFTCGELERDLAVALGIPVFAADPRLASLATRSGSRKLFVETGVECPAGIDGLHSEDDVVDAIRRLRDESEGLLEARVKLDQSDLWDGELRVPLHDLPATTEAEESRAIRERLHTSRFSSGDVEPEHFLARVEQAGAVVEACSQAAEQRLASVDLRITPLGTVEVQATHERVVDEAGSTPLLWRFPADSAYAAAIVKEGAKIGERLTQAGVLGTVSIGFDVTRVPGGTWTPRALQVRLGKGSTTMSLLTMVFLTDGRYRPESGRFEARQGQEKCYLSADEVASSSFRAISPDELFDFVVRHGLHFDHATQTGIVLHNLSAVTELGRVGLTAVADSHQDARELFDRAVATLGFEAERAAAALELPE